MKRPTWGDTVRIKDHAPPQMRPGNLASVCGMRTVETREQAKVFGCPVSTTVFLVEFSDGSSIELADFYLEMVAAD